MELPPLYLSSTFALPSTNNPPFLPRTHGRSWANRYASTIRSLAYWRIFNKVIRIFETKGRDIPEYFAMPSSQLEILHEL